MIRAEEVRIEWDEGGCELHVETAEGERLAFLVSNPESLYDSVKSAILPWLMEGYGSEAVRTARKERVA